MLRRGLARWRPAMPKPAVRLGTGTNRGRSQQMARDSILACSLRLIVLIGLGLAFGFFMLAAMLWCVLTIAVLQLGQGVAWIYRKARLVR